MAEENRPENDVLDDVTENEAVENDMRCTRRGGGYDDHSLFFFV